MTDQIDQQALDSILEDEIRRGFRVKELPTDLQAQLKAYGVPTFGRFRLVRMNPSRRRKLNEAVQRAYHKDLQNEDLLSNEQIMKLVVQRGEWGPEKEARIKELQRTTSITMGKLYQDGLAQDTSKWAESIVTEAEGWRGLLAASELAEDEKKRIEGVFSRWIEYDPSQQSTYTELYAESQERDSYSPERDSMILTDAVPSLEALQHIENLEELLDKMHLFVQLTTERAELAELQMRHARIFADSVESRRENAEEMARLYFTAEVVNEADQPTGPIAPTFDALWDFPEDVIQYLLVESYFFHNGIPDETRPYLETFGFIRGERKENSASEVSGESPVPPSSNPDSPVADTTP